MFTHNRDYTNKNSKGNARLKSLVKAQGIGMLLFYSSMLICAILVIIR